VIATQNPVEFHGTYPLPEAQLDRFTMRISLGYPDVAHEVEAIFSQNQGHPFENLASVVSCERILELQSQVRQVHCDRAIGEYIVRLVDWTRRDARLKLGISMRGSLALHRTAQARAKISGRDYVLPDDAQALAIPVLAHRLALDTKAKYAGARNEAIIEEALEKVEVPR
jgi:MoxR-like ATPase